MTPWLTVIGIGEDGLAGVSPAARALIEGAEILVGGIRHLALTGTLSAERHEWPSPFGKARALLNSLRPRRVVVLASGDPMWFGIGATLARWFDPAELTILPHPGAFSLAASRLAWPLQDCLCLSVHGRPVDALALHLAPGRRWLVLAEDGESADRVAALLRKGYGQSRMILLERLGGPDESIHSTTAATWTGPADPLAVIAVEVVADPGIRPYSLVPGLPDDAFLHDGQLTKREIRAITLAALAPLPNALLWDVGAGCGSIAIEWMRAGGRAVAIESDSTRCDRIARNAAALGVPGLDIINAPAPAGLPNDRTPDAIFVGGGISAPGMLDACLSALQPGGRLVANAVTTEGEAALIAYHATHGGEMTRLAVARLDRLGGGYHSWHPAMPVTQYAGWKP